MGKDLEYEQMKEAVKSEQELMKFMLELGPQKFQQLMDATRAQAKSKASAAAETANKAKAEMARAKAEENKAAYAHKDKELAAKERLAKEKMRTAKEKDLELAKEATRRKEQEVEGRKQLMRAQTEEERKRNQIKVEAKKKLIDYGVQKETEAEAQRARIRLEEEQKVSDMHEQRLRREEEARNREVQRQLQVVARKEEIKQQMLAERERKNLDVRIKEHLAIHEATKEFNMERDAKMKQLDMEGAVEVAKAKWEGATAFFSGEEGKGRMLNIATATGLTIAAWYGGKAAYPALRRAITDRFYKPNLITESVRSGFFPSVRRAFSGFNAPVNRFKQARVVLQPQLEHHLASIASSTNLTRSRGGLFGHMLLYGEPGTGKTLFARQLARDSDMDFAIMSGSSFEQFSPSDQIVEIKNLFRWAHRASKGLLIFVDEADSFLENRDTLTTNRVRVLNEWISQTGTETEKFMLVYASNRAHILDPAVQSRVTRSVAFPAPGVPELKRMLTQFVDNILKVPAKTGETPDVSILDDDETVGLFAEELAKEKFVGRDVINLIICIQHAVFGAEGFKLTPQLLEDTVRQQIMKKKQESKFLEEHLARVAASKHKNLD